MADSGTTRETDLLVIGGGPGGYHAAFRASTHGIQTMIVDSMGGLGGVCLHRGCIPSKTLLSMAETMHTAACCKDMGINFGEPRLDVEAIRNWKGEVISKLTRGLDMQAKKFKVERIQGTARFADGNAVNIGNSSPGSFFYKNRKRIRPFYHPRHRYTIEQAVFGFFK